MRVPVKVDGWLVRVLGETLQLVWTIFETSVRAGAFYRPLAEAILFILGKLDEAVLTSSDISRQLASQSELATTVVIILSDLGHLHGIDNEAGELRIRRMLDKIRFVLLLSHGKGVNHLDIFAPSVSR